MKKPDSLRELLATVIPLLAREPERLSLFVDKGRIRATGGGTGPDGRVNLSHEYQYKLTLILLDWTAGPDAVMVPLLAWVAANQPELLLSVDQNRQGIAFEVDILDADTVDLQIELDLTERVLVRSRGSGGYDVEHLDEPRLDPGFGPWPDTQPDPVALRTLYVGGELILGGED